MFTAPPQKKQTKPNPKQTNFTALDYNSDGGLREIESVINN